MRTITTTGDWRELVYGNIVAMAARPDNTVWVATSLNTIYEIRDGAISVLEFRVEGPDRPDELADSGDHLDWTKFWIRFRPPEFWDLSDTE